MDIQSRLLDIKRWLTVAGFSMLLSVGTAQAAINVANAPLFLTVSVLPAMIMAVDDSGSMDSEILVRSNDGALWWHTTDESFTGRDMDDQSQPGVINFNKTGGANGTWKKYVYLFPNGTGQSSGKRKYGDSNNDHYAVPPLGAYAFARSPEYNYSYFNPANTYVPWPDLGGQVFEDSDPENAKTDPILGSDTLNLTELRESSNDNYKFRMHPGMVIPAGTRYRDWNDSTWKTTLTDVVFTDSDVEQDKDGRSVAISYFPATFYLREDTDLAADFGYDSDKARLNGSTGDDAVIDGTAPDGTDMIRYEIKEENFVTQDAYRAAIQNFANWFTYYRKRHIAVRGAIGTAFEDIEGFRVGAYKINSRPSSATNLKIRNLSLPDDRNEFFEEIYTEFWGGGGTPNREAVNHMRSQFARTDANAPIAEACQMNFGLLFTDGYANTWTSAGVNNKDGGMGSPFADSMFNTMADIAAELYLENPRSDLTEGQVPTPTQCSLASPPASLDCNDNLHVNLFALTMGAPGTIFKVDEQATLDPFNNQPSWPTKFSDRNPVHVDDLWHATLNSRGLLVDVNVPSELGDRFGEILSAIAARLNISATAAAASTASLQTETQLYRAGFRSTDWTGTLHSYALNSDGSVGNVLWDAEEQLRDKLDTGSRNLFTFDGASGVSLEWSELSSDQQDALNRSVSDSTTDNLGEERLDWLTGSESDSASFRSRSDYEEERLLGDIVNSHPHFQSTSHFASSRPDMLYVGANDGMLHGFNAETGEELFGYVPSELLNPESGSETFAPINQLMEPDYVDQHRYFVDGSPTVIDIKLDGSWKTVLIGAMGAGGRTVFALDVTDPENFSADDILWEFSDDDLGEGVSQPAIMELMNEKYGVVFGNGYNSDSETAILFILNIKDGSVIQKIDTGEGGSGNSNGLSPALGSDWSDSDGVVRQIYAGDLLGNLWRFDVSSTNPKNWSRDILFYAQDPDENPQPITARPQIAIDSDYKPMILFGTGSYFRTDDRSSTQVQSIYGIKDDEEFELERDDLLEQTIVSQSDQSFTDSDTGDEFSYSIREVSDNAITSESGWYLDLIYDDDAQGERVISPASFPSGRDRTRVRFSTLIPDDDPCGTGRSGYVMDIQIGSGAQNEMVVFDLNRDRAFDDEDTFTPVGQDEAALVSGVGYGAGEPITVVVDSPLDLLYSGGNDDTPLHGRGDSSNGRQSWQQLR